MRHLSHPSTTGASIRGLLIHETQTSLTTLISERAKDVVPRHIRPMTRCACHHAGWLADDPRPAARDEEIEGHFGDRTEIA
jgi:hypothetical protein